jgi:hypothetical protein
MPLDEHLRIVQALALLFLLGMLLVAIRPLRQTQLINDS